MDVVGLIFLNSIGKFSMLNYFEIFDRCLYFEILYMVMQMIIFLLIVDGYVDYYIYIDFWMWLFFVLIFKNVCDLL